MRTVGTQNAPPRSPSILPTNWWSLSSLNCAIAASPLRQFARAGTGAHAARSNLLLSPRRQFQRGAEGCVLSENTALRTAHRVCARMPFGVSPKRERKSRLKCEISEKPVCNALSQIWMSLESCAASNMKAFFSRSSVTRAVKDAPESGNGSKSTLRQGLAYCSRHFLIGSGCVAIAAPLAAELAVGRFPARSAYGSLSPHRERGPIWG